MKLFEVLKDINYNNQKLINVEISSLKTNSLIVSYGDLFFCIKGTKVDGHNYAKMALEKGALYVVCERDLGLEKQIIVDDTSVAFAISSCNFFDNPSKKLKIIGVTGTNGKTSSTFLIKSILSNNGFKVGLIGTIKNQIGDIDLQSKYTTPDAFELNSLLDKMCKSNCTYVIMEVSSHALEQNRVYGIEFNTALFTNLTQDHLDYHLTMENYFECKKKLFYMSKNKIVNLDDKYGEKISKEVSCDVHTFSINKDSDLIAKNLKFSASSVQFECVYKNLINRIYFNMPGEFTVYNLLGAIYVCILEGIKLKNISKSLENIEPIRGRSEILYSKEFTVICDYAHTADGIESFLKSIKPYVKGKLISLFGCAGERDRTKREGMALAVSKYSDFAVLTSDNPRKEDPLEIIKDTEKGLIKSKTPYVSFADRYGAILWAMSNIQKDDVLCLLGKGHEDYQVLYSNTIYFDEHKIINDILEDKGLL